MNSRRLMTLTTLGLSLRDEILVNSLLNIVGDTTLAEWRFVDEMDADLALCDPKSSLARLALQQSERSTRPCCIALKHDDKITSPLSRTIRAPLRVREFVEMLNTMSDTEIATVPVADALASTSASAGTLPPDSGAARARQSLANALSELSATVDTDRRQSVWRIMIGGFTLDLTLPDRRYVMRDHDVTVDALVDLALSADVESVVRLEVQDAQQGSEAAQAMPMPRPLDTLLWRVGLKMRPDPDMPWLKDDIALRLKRWPDFGHLGSHKAHLALAALLTKRSWRMNELIDASGQTKQQLQAFLIACGMCGLLRIENVASMAVASPVVLQRFGVSGLFRTLRSALGMGG